MSLSKRDIIIIVIIFLSAWAIGWFSHSFISPVTPSKPFDDSKYKKSEDSLKSLIRVSNDSLEIYRKHIFYTDSLVLVNFKTKKKNDVIIKNFTPVSRAHYLDSIFKSAGL